MTHCLIFPQQPSTSQIGFGYILEAFINPSTPTVIQWIVTPLTIASLMDTSG
jgi:hypothetical protein